MELVQRVMKEKAFFIEFAKAKENARTKFEFTGGPQSRKASSSRAGGDTGLLA